MGSTRWDYHKEMSFATNYVVSLKIKIEYKNLLQIVDLMHQVPKCPYSNFS